MEVAIGHDDLGLGILDLLHVVGPLADGLESRFYGLGAAVHEQGLVEARQLAELFQERRELIVAEGAASEGQLLHLVDHGLADARVVVALVHGGVGGQEIHVLLALHIREVDTLALGADHVQGVVVVGSVMVFLIDELGRLQDFDGHGTSGSLSGCGKGSYQFWKGRKGGKTAGKVCAYAQY